MKELYDVELAGRDSFVALYRLLRRLYLSTDKESRSDIMISLSVVRTPIESGDKYYDTLIKIEPELKRVIRSFGFSYSGLYFSDTAFKDMKYWYNELWSKLCLTNKDIMPCIGCHMFCHMMHADIITQCLYDKNMYPVTIVTGERIAHGDKKKANQTSDILDVYFDEVLKGSNYTLFPILEDEGNNDSIAVDMACMCAMLNINEKTLIDAAYVCPIGSVFADEKFPTNANISKEDISNFFMNIATHMKDSKVTAY